MKTRGFQVGDTIRHYHLDRLLGKGGMGAVYLARDTRLNRPVAIKVLHPKLAVQGSLKSRFFREARSAAAITHPAIAQIYEIDEWKDITHIVMEYVQGQTLGELIKKGELDLASSVEVALQVAEGLSKAHQTGIIHRDIKPANIMVTPEGHVKLLDFGLAKLLAGQSSVDHAASPSSGTEVLYQTTAGTVLGTIAYMSPEQTRGQTMGPPSDIFSLGIVMYEMIAGKLPFTGESPVDTMHAIVYDEVEPVTVIRKNLPAEVHRIISTCLRKLPRDRYPDAGRLAADLKQLKQDIDSGVVRGVSPVHRFRAVYDHWKGILSDLPLPAVILVALGVVAVMILVIGIKWESLIFPGLVGLLIFRYIKNRKKRLIKKFVGRMRRFREIKVVTVRENRIRVYADRAQAKLYVKVNSLVDQINQKLFFGRPLEVSVIGNLADEQLAPVLKESGVLYVRDDVLRDS